MVYHIKLCVTAVNQKKGQTIQRTKEKEQKKTTNEQTMIYIAMHRKLKIEHHESH
jgi:hypothetical protein